MTGFEEAIPDTAYVRKGDKFVAYIERGIFIGEWVLRVREIDSTKLIRVTEKSFYDCSTSCLSNFYSPDGIKHYEIKTILESAENILIKMGYD